jgi:hypothetical protein
MKVRAEGDKWPMPSLTYSRLADRHSRVRFEKSAKTDWLEMGLLSISFVARTTPDGQLAIEV